MMSVLVSHGRGLPCSPLLLLSVVLFCLQLRDTCSGDLTLVARRVEARIQSVIDRQPKSATV